MPLTDSEWEFLSTSHNDWVDDVANILEGLIDAAENAERSVEGASLAGTVVRNLRVRLHTAIQEVTDRTNDLTVRVARLQKD